MPIPNRFPGRHESKQQPHESGRQRTTGQNRQAEAGLPRFSQTYGGWP